MQIFQILTVGTIAALGLACSSAPKVPRPELSDMIGKKVALVDIEGEATHRNIVEVALINQLTKRGTFILVNKKEIRDAKSLPDTDPTNWKEIARKSGAHYALKANVMDFEAIENKGYNRVKVYDSLIEEEQGSGRGEVDRLVKVKSLTGKIKVEMTFAELPEEPPEEPKPDAVGYAEASKTVKKDETHGAIHLPPVLGFLEELANQAFEKFFEEYD